MDVGAGVMMQAEAASISTLLVDIGLGFQVECDIAEAREVASLHLSTAQVSHTTACFLRLFLPPEHLQPWLGGFETPQQPLNTCRDHQSACAGRHGTVC